MRAVINFYLTWKCNYTCAHCIHECGPQGNHMTLEQIDYGFRFIHWLKEQDIPVCIFGTTGGEATLHPLFWTEYMPRLKVAREAHQCREVELHSNASQPVPEEFKKQYCKFFSNVYVGHDSCHRQFGTVKDLYLQDYSDIAYSVHLRFNDYPVGPFPHCISIRDKGRAHESLINGRLIEIPCQGRPSFECTWNGNRASDALNIIFTPDHINHCGEKSHPLPSLPYDQGHIEEGQFHSYGMDFDKLWHAALDYQVKYSGKNCSQKCMVKFARLA